MITGQQWLDFCALIDQPAWAEDESLFIAMERRRRAHDLLGVIRAWTTQRTTAEIVEIASLMRIPVAADRQRAHDPARSTTSSTRSGW